MDKKAYLDYAWPLFEALAQNQKQQRRARKNVNRLRSSYLSEDNMSRATRLLYKRSKSMDTLRDLRQEQLVIFSFLSPIC